MTAEHRQLQDWLASMEDVEAGSFLFRQGDPVVAVLWVECGLVKLMRSDSQTREVTIGLRGPRTLLGQADAALGVPHRTSVVAAARTRVRGVSLDDFWRLLFAESAFSRFVLEAASRELQHSGEDSTRRSLHPEQRLLSLLSALDLEEPAEAGKPVEVRLPEGISPAELADLIGVSPADLHRLFAAWEQAGGLCRQGGAISFRRSAFPRDLSAAPWAEDQRIREAVSFVRENAHDADLDLDRLSRRLNLSPWYVSRLFKRTLGLGFRKFLNTVRLEQARVALLTTPLSIKEIAASAGFRHASDFTRGFKALYGVSPSAYRLPALVPARNDENTQANGKERGATWLEVEH